MAELYIGVVDWNKDYKHVLQVTGNQFNNVLTHMNTHELKPIHIKAFTLIKIHDGSGEIAIDEYYERIQFFNYVMFRNSTSGKYFYAFIDSMGFEAHKTLHIKFTIDIWQMYTGSLTFKNSFVERMHIAKSADTVGRWLAPEPFNFPLEYETVIDTCDTDFTPNFMVLTVSRPRNGRDDFEYGGQATGGELTNYSPYYGFKVNSVDGIHNTLKWFEPSPRLLELNFIDHRHDVVGCVCVPSFVYENLGSSTDGGNPDAEDPRLPFPIAGSPNVTVNDSLDLTPNTLSCGYQPQNNKLFTSICKKYILCNRNGLRIELKPELFTANTISINFSGKGFDTQTLKMVVGNYRFYSKNTFSLPYNAVLPICYNQNDGVVKQLNTLKAVTGAVTQPQNIIQNVENVMNTAFGSVGESVGSTSGEVLPLTNYYFRPRLVDVSPLADHCRELDNYLTTYGYQINEIMLPTITSRSNWNYLQGDINFSCNANGNDKERLKQIFKNGVTVWHSPTNMINYSLSNN